jgi:hypothetical protein
MARKTRHTNPDPHVARILDRLGQYEAAHPGSEIEVYRQNPAAIRIRIIDPDFRGVDRVDREARAWDVLGELPEDVQGEVSLLLLLTPEETSASFANDEFENPVPSSL